MNTEKEITFADLKAKFTKDFDSFGKMDPFLEFTLGKCVARTETASSNILFYVGAGKEPAWKNQAVLVYFDQAFLTIRAYDEDATENQFMGAAKVEIKSLRFPGGAIEANVLTESGENIGTITGKYTIKNLAAVPLLLVKNIKCDFVKQHSFLGKTKPYLQLKSEEGSTVTEHKEEAKGLSISWNDSLRLRIKENSKITVSLLDKNENETYIFKYQGSAKEYRVQNGTKKINVLDKGYLYLGTVQFDFETVNLVSKEESVKNTDKEKKSDSELTSIAIDKVKLDLQKGNKQVYLRILIGSNELTTPPVKYESSTMPLDLKKTIYAESKENKMIILLWEKNLLKDKVIGQSTCALENFSSGDKKIQLIDEENKEKAQIGSIMFNFTVKQVVSKILNLDSLVVTFTEGADLIGDSEPYIVAKVGGWSARTETGDANKFNFKKSIEIKYFDEEVLELQVWDEDVTNDEIMYTQKVNLVDLKGQKGEYSINLTKKENDKVNKKGKLTFKYDIKNNAPQEIPRKPSEKKIVPEVKPEPKPEPKVAPKQEKQTEVKPEPPKVQIKAEPKVESKPEEKPITERKAFDASKTIEPKQTESMPSAREKRLTEQQPKSDKDIPQNGDVTKRQQTNKNTNRSLNKESRSKETLNLPSIISSHMNYGDRIFDKQSAATLQKTILVYSMPKAPRFVNEPKYSGEPSYCLDSCFKPSSTKGVGFGYGRKKQYPDWMERNMKENPPPGAYFDNNSDVRSRGPTFGISHKFYEKVMIPKEKRNSSQLNRKLEPIKDTPK